MKELTDHARANLASGATSGPGTSVCAGCEGVKEATRLNSARCSDCGKGGLAKSASDSTVRIIRATLPTDVAERFVAEAEAAGMQANTYLTELVKRRDTRKYGATP